MEELSQFTVGTAMTSWHITRRSEVRDEVILVGKTIVYRQRSQLYIY